MDMSDTKFNLPDRTPQFEKIANKQYLVKSFEGVFEAATSAIGHGVSKVEYVCPESEHTRNTSCEYPRVMSFARDPNNNYCALVTFSMNATQLKEVQSYFA